MFQHLFLTWVDHQLECSSELLMRDSGGLSVGAGPPGWRRVGPRGDVRWRRLWIGPLCLKTHTNRVSEEQSDAWSNHRSEHTVPEGCTVGWAGRGGGGRVKVCNGERLEGRAGVLGGNQAACCGSAAAWKALGGKCRRSKPAGCRHVTDARSHPGEENEKGYLIGGFKWKKNSEACEPCMNYRGCSSVNVWSHTKRQLHFQVCLQVH